MGEHPSPAAIHEQKGCKVCLAPCAALTTFDATERMFGTGERFTYHECGACGSLQIATVPADLGRHYPPAYYSFNQKPRRLAQGVFARLRARRLLKSGRVTAHRKGVWQVVEWLGAAGCSTASAILDVGCGDGMTLRRLAALGFERLEGVDPFLPGDVTLAEGIRLHKRDLAAMDGRYDAILMDHAFEHVPAPAETLTHLRRLLADGHNGGAALIAIPVAGCASWRASREHWCGLDAPRHLVIPSEKGFRGMAERVGMHVAAVHYYSTRHHLMWNEMYRRGIPLEGPDGIRSRDLRKELGRHALGQFARQAAQNNARNEGDVAVFLVKRA